MAVRILDVVLIALAAYLAVIGIVYIFQEYLTFAPDRSSLEPREWQASGMEEIHFRTVDNIPLTSLYKSAQPGKPTLIYFQGNAGHIGQRLPTLLPYLKAGYGLFLLGYRGFGGNPGKPSEQGLYQDARAGMLFLQQQGVVPSCTVVYGESMGSGIAVQMATEYSVAALVLQSPYTSLTEVGKVRYPFLPVSLLLKNRFESLSKLHQIHKPLFVGHGQKDRVVPFKFGKQLYDAYKGPKEAYFAPQLKHDDIQDDVFYAHVSAFLKKYVTECVE